MLRKKACSMTSPFMAGPGKSQASARAASDTGLLWKSSKAVLAHSGGEPGLEAGEDAVLLFSLDFLFFVALSTCMPAERHF